MGPEALDGMVRVLCVTVTVAEEEEPDRDAERRDLWQREPRGHHSTRHDVHSEEPARQRGQQRSEERMEEDPDDVERLAHAVTP